MLLTLLKRVTKQLWNSVIYNFWVLGPFQYIYYWNIQKWSKDKKMFYKDCSWWGGGRGRSLTENARAKCLGGMDHFSTLASIISRTSWHKQRGDSQAMISSS